MIGEALAFASAVAFAMGSVAVARGAKVDSSESGVLLSILVTGTLAAVGWLAFGHSPAQLAATGSGFWTAMGWFCATGILATVWGRLALFQSVKFAGVVRATTVRRLTPFVSVLFAWALLGDVVTGLMGVGMLLMALSFVLLIVDSRNRLDTAGLPEGADLTRGYTFGVICAVAYAASYISRKSGLDILPDAYFGAFIGSMAALAYYLCGCMVSSDYRAMVARTLTRPNSWQLVAAFCISAGQISQFMALTHTTVSRVAIINSVEIFISFYLAVFLFRTERWPPPVIVVATLVATAGIVTVVVG